MDYARYNSATATHMPFAAGSPPNLPPRDAEQLGLLLQQTVEELNAMDPGPAQMQRRAFLLGEAQQVQHNLAQAWTVPGAWMGIHRQVVELKRAVADLQAGPYNVGDNRQGISAGAPMLQGLGSPITAQMQQRARKDRQILIWGTVAAMITVAGVMGMLDAPKGRGTRGVGNPHGLRVNFKNPKFPGARKAK
jgi:hypothetical protein